jgi:hypothetical protein
MRNYLSGYIRSLTAGSKAIAESFVWDDRRNLSTTITTDSARLDISSKHAYSNQRVMYGDFMSVFNNVAQNMGVIYDQANSAAAIREATQLQVDAKLSRIESALQTLDQDIQGWLDTYSQKAESVHEIKRSFGAFGVRPIVYFDGMLNKLSTIVESNADAITDGNLIYVNAPDRIQERLFSDDEGLQVRVTYNFTPGLVTRIRLEPMAGIGGVYINELRAYGPNGLVATLAAGEELSRSLEYSIPRSIVQRLEFDLIDKTYNLVDVATNQVKTGVRRTVIPAHSEKNVVTDTITQYWREIEAFSLSQTQLYLIEQVYDGKTGITMPSGYDGILYMMHHPEIPGFAQATTALTSVVGNAFTTFGETSTGMKDWIDNLFRLRYGGTETVTKDEWVYIPEQILLHNYTYSETEVLRRYRYEIGLKNLACFNDFYSEIYRYAEEVRFEGGAPSSLTLVTDEFCPEGSYVNMFLFDTNGNSIPLLPENKDFVCEILRFDEHSRAQLLFFPNGGVSFRKGNGEGVVLALNGKTVLGPSMGLDIISNNAQQNETYWALYQPDRTRANSIPQSGRVATYVSESGEIGEVFHSIPDSKTLSLKEIPFIDNNRVGETGYSPVQVIIDGYTTVDLTKYDSTYEEEFPVDQTFRSGERVVHYRMRGNTIFFESSIERPVRVLYEFVVQKASIMVEMGVISPDSAAPVLYQYSLSYI